MPRVMPKYREPVFVVLLAILLALFAHRLLALVYGLDLRRSILSDLLLLDGKPHWRLFQNRVLGPLVERAFMHVFGVPDLGFIAFHVVCFATAFMLAWHIGLRIVGSRAGALAAMLTSALSLVALFMPNWFYAWDVMGIALYMGFAWLIVVDARYGWIVLLFAVAIWNRDDAVFIGLFLTVQPILVWLRTRTNPARPPFAWRPAVPGVVCMVGGVVLISLLRRWLLVEEMGPALFGPPRDNTAFFQWNLKYNFDFVLHVLRWKELSLIAFILVPPLVITIACIWLARVRGGRYLGYALVNLAMVAAALMFGSIHEIRIWVDLLPPIVVATSFALAAADATTGHETSGF